MASVSPSAPVQQLLDRLKKVKRSGSGWIACCPAHDDSDPSLAIDVGADGRAVVFCHSAHCTARAIAEAVGLTESDLFVEPRKPALSVMRAGEKTPVGRPRMTESYAYVTDAGELLYEACRLEYPVEGGGKPKKTFRQRRPNPQKPGDWIWDLEGVTRVPYRLPELIEAVAAGRSIYVPEGEKHVNALYDLRMPATCNVGGAGKWRDEYSALMRGAEVVVLADNDESGRNHAEQVAVSLHAHDCRVKVVHLKEIWSEIPEKGDIVDWLNRPGDHSEDLDVFGALCDRTPLWQPEQLRNRVRTRFRLDELLANDEIMRPPAPVIPRIAWGARSTLLSGREKLGKSTLLGYLTACVTNGDDFLDRDEPCQRGDVLYISIDEYEGDTARRLQMFGARTKHVEVVRQLLGTTLQDRVQEVRDHVTAVKPVVVILDSLHKFGIGLVKDENAAEVGAVVYALSDIAHDLGPALIITHHARKSDGQTRGSTAIPAAVDIVCQMLQLDEWKDSRPTLRRIESAGRVPVIPRTDFEYNGGYYYLDGKGELPIEERLFAYIRSHPGCSARDAKESVRGKRGADIDSALGRMLGARRVLNQGTGRGMKLFVPAAGHQSLFGAPAPADPQRNNAAAAGQSPTGNQSESLGNHSGNHSELDDPF